MDAPLDYTEYRYSVLFSGAAKGVGRLNNGARVQIPPTPTRKSSMIH